MDYKKTNWISDETLVSAENLNNIENGIEGLAQESHTHNNKTTLETLTESKINQIEHNNRSVLDALTPEMLETLQGFNVVNEEYAEAGLNEITDIGLYGIVADGTPNVPDGEEGNAAALLVLPAFDGVIQVFIPYGVANIKNDRMYIRTLYNHGSGNEISCDWVKIKNYDADVATVQDSLNDLIEGKPNIAKNSDDTTGDIIDSHLTIGNRQAQGYSPKTLSVGENHWTFNENQVAFGKGAYVKGRNSSALFGEGCAAGESGYDNSAAGGLNVKAYGARSCAFGGYQNSISYKAVSSAVLGGQDNNVFGRNSAIIAGNHSIINENGNNSFCSGEYLVANAYNFIVGRYNIAPTNGTTVDGTLFSVGCGTSDANRSNAMRVDTSGNIYAKTTINATGADYAELWEWMDGNPEGEDRAGYFATMDSNKIRLSQNGDNLARVGVISGNPAIIGDNYADEWCGKYLRDIYGRYLRERVSYPEIKDEDGNVIQQAYEADELILNPDYNPDEAYIPREQRKEYDFLGTHGKLVVHDDGTCEANGFCKPTNGGIATAAENGYHVMERIDENHIRIYIR